MPSALRVLVALAALAATVLVATAAPAQVLAVEAPGQPTGLTATPIGATRIDLFWTAPAYNGSKPITGYKIDASTNGTTWNTLVATTGNTDTAYSHTGLTVNTTRHYRVFAISDDGTSVESHSATATTSATVALVSNAGQTGSSNAPIKQDHHQPFTTGPNALGYTITRIELNIAAVGANMSIPAMSIYTLSGTALGATKVGDLTAPSSITATGAAAWTSTGIDLAASTKYTILLNASATSTATGTLSVTTASAEDAGSSSGWSIADSGYTRAGNATANTWNLLNDPKRIRITGTLKGTAPRTDATLSALTVSPKNIIRFIPALEGTYVVGVASTVTTATVLATPTDSAAGFVYSGTDTDTATPGHQVSLSAGRNAVTVTVTAEDGTTTMEYSVDINRGVTTTFGWKASDDLDGLRAAANYSSRGVWSNGTTMWVADTGNRLYAYTLSDGARDSSKEFSTTVANGSPQGIWSDETTMWVADLSDGKLYAYNMSTKAYDSAKDFDTLDGAGNDKPRGIWSNGTTMWVADQDDDKLYAYSMSTKAHDSAKDITLATGNNAPQGIWSDETTMWVTQYASPADHIYAYNMADKMRNSALEFAVDAHGHDAPHGIWSDGTTMWVNERSSSDKVYSYNHPLYATSSEVGGTSLVINFNRNPAAAASLANSAFEVKKTSGGTEATVTLSGSPSISGSTLTLTLAAAVTASDTDIKVSYTKPTSGSNNKLVDSNGNDVIGVSNLAVINNTPATAPGAPTGLTAAATGPARIDLSWTAPADDGGATISGYVVEGSSDDGGTWSVLGRLDATFPGFTHLNLTANSTWHYRVAARNSVGTGPVSNTAMDTTNVFIRNTESGGDSSDDAILDLSQPFTTGANTAGYLLTSIEVVSEDTAGDDFSAEIWTVDSSDHPDEIHAALDPPSSFAAGKLTFTAPKRTTLVASTTYAVVVSVVGSERVTYDATTFTDADRGHAMGWAIDGAFDYKDMGAWTTNGTKSLRIAVRGENWTAAAPDPPTGLTATANGPNRIDLAWTAPADNGGATISGYKIEGSTDGITWTSLVGNNGTGTVYIHSGLAAHSTRHYRVSAINSAGTGAPSDPATETTNVYVSTVGQGSLGENDTALDLSQRFTVGAQTGGYTLVGIDIASVDTNGDDFTAAVWTVDTTSGHPDTKLTDLASPSSFAAGTLSFSAPGGVTLDASTTYALVVSLVGTGNVTYSRTTSTSEDSGGATGWSIKNTYEWKDTGGNWRDDTAVRSLRIAVRAAPVATSLVSNTGQTDEDTIPLANDVAVAFTTGASGSGYSVTEVSLDLGTVPAGSSVNRVTINENDTSTSASSGAPTSTVVGTLTGPSSLTANASNAWRSSGIDLDPGATYVVVVHGASGSTAPLQRTNSNGEDSGSASDWSIFDVGRSKQGTTGIWARHTRKAQIAVGGFVKVSTNAPEFADDTVTRSVAENTPAGENVGAVVDATDADMDDLVYTLGGTDAASFDIVEGTGQIQTRSGITYNHEAKSSYTVTVTATDGTNSATATVTINVTDVAEPPVAPAAPAVTGRTNNSRGVSWTAPPNAGKPAITGYDVQYRLLGASSWTTGAGSTTTSISLLSLVANRTYEIQVRAANDEGDGSWSASGSTASGTLVGNTGQTVSTQTVENRDDRAQRFTTGGAGAIIASVEIASQDSSGDDFSASVWSVNSSGYPMTRLFDLTPPASFAAGTLVFNAPTNTTLAASTTYSVRLSRVGSENVQYSYTDLNPEDAGAAANWSIANDHDIRGSGDAWGTDNLSRSMRIAVKGISTATAPGQPTGLSATANGQTRIDLAWTAPTSDGGASISGYKIEVSSNGTSFTGLVDSQTATTYSHTGLSAGSTRHYRVSAINSVGTSPVSSTATATTATPTATVPGAPTGLSATASGPSRIDLAWNAPTSNGGASISGYKIEVSSNGTSYTILVDSQTPRTYSHTGLSASSTRHYRVSAINSVGTGAVSSRATATTPAATTVPGQPRNLTATASGPSRIDLAWRAPASDGGASISGYKIEFSTNGTSYTNLVDSQTATTYSHTGLSASSTRHYRVSAINSVGTGAVSSRATATTPAAATVPGQPRNLTATANGQTRIDLSWRAPASDGGASISGYKIEVSDNGTSYTNLVDSQTARTYSHTGLSANNTRHYRVSAINSVGTGAVSSRATATTTPTSTPTPPGTTPPGGTPGGGGGAVGGGGGGAVGGGGGGGGGPTPSTLDFEWNVTRDIDPLDDGNDTPTGMWSDGATLWILQNSAGSGDAVYAYDLETGERVEDREFDLAETNRAPRGIWSDGTTVWVSDSGRDHLFAYNLESGERDEERDIELTGRNSDARGIWSDGATMWVFDNHRDGLFAYGLASGELLDEYALASAHGDPRGAWSDGVTIWVSDHTAKRVFAYRVPALEDEQDAPDDATDDADEPRPLERVIGEEFTAQSISGAGNNSPRGLWSDGDVMYVVDASDGKVYTYNMPDAIDARLASLSLEGIEIGEFGPGETDYAGSIGEGVTATVVTAEAVQPRAAIVIDPSDADGNDANGHQVALEGLAAITVTVTSADGSREQTYRVALADATDEPGDTAEDLVDTAEPGDTDEPGDTAEEPWAHCLRGAVAVGFSLVMYEGGSVDDLAACASSRGVTALYSLHEGAYVSYILGAPDFVNAGFSELYAGGVPALTPLVAASNGPPSVDPVGDIAVPQSGAGCLRGEVAEGFSLVIYEGSNVEDLGDCARSRGVTALYALADGAWVSYIVGAPAFVNAPFGELFTGGVPAATALVVKSDAPVAAEQDGDGGDAGN